jgi:hypothetical protein
LDEVDALVIDEEPNEPNLGKKSPLFHHFLMGMPGKSIGNPL